VIKFDRERICLAGCVAIRVMKTATHMVLARLLLVFALSLCAYPTSSQSSGAATRPITIGADITGDGLVSLPVRVNGSEPMWFALDSGASFGFVLDSRRAKDLRLKLQGNLTGTGGAGPNPYEISLASGVSIDLGGLKFNDQMVHVISLESLEAIGGSRLDGLVGIELFTRYVVELDYAAHQVTLRDPRTYKYSGSGESVPLTLRDNHFFVPGKLEMPDRKGIDGNFIVDTGGAPITLVLTSPFAKSHTLPALNQKAIFDGSLSGLGGQTKLLVTRGTSFWLGRLALREPVIYLSQDQGGALANADFDGLIGGEILNRFKVIFDYARGRLILEPSVSFNTPIEYDASGIRLRAEGADFRTFTVSQVLPGSPAGDSGIREGDVLILIDGVKASTFSLDQIYQMLKQPGREFTLTLKRGSQTSAIKIKTRKLI